MMLSDVLAPLDNGSGGCPPPPEGVKLLGLKGPGDSLGVPQLPPTTTQPSSAAAAAGSTATVALAAAAAAAQPHVWKVYVRARGPATVFVARLADLARLVEAHPEMAAAVQQMVTQQETDMMVAEAMRQLRLYNDAATSRSHAAAVAAATTAAEQQRHCSDMDVSWASPHQQAAQQPLA
jgi:hypothetical protein